MIYNKSRIYDALPDPRNLQLRRLYRMLEQHYKNASCKLCTFYSQYGVMIVKGDLIQHIADIIIDDGSAKAPTINIEMQHLLLLDDAGLIEIREITPRQHRLAFVLMQHKEAMA